MLPWTLKGIQKGCLFVDENLNLYNINNIWTSRYEKKYIQIIPGKNNTFSIIRELKINEL
jgi:hypothetical protein